MSEKTIKFNNYPDFRKYLNDNNIWAFEFWVDSNPWGEGGRQKLRAIIFDNENISTRISGQSYINGIDYQWTDTWRTQYTGTFELVLPESLQHVKPEVYKQGDLVEILENARECGDFEGWVGRAKNMIGTLCEIREVRDNAYGIYYQIYTTDQSDWWWFPHYCVKKVGQKDETVELTLEQIAQKFEVDVKNLKIKK